MQPTRIAHLQTADQFAKESGLTVETVRAWITRGYVPTIKIGKRRMIEVSKISEETYSTMREAS